MVGRAGQPKGWPVLCSGSANPVRLTTHRFAPDGGDYFFKQR
ncbi:MULTISPECIES: ash family protein [unclassified Serratia (in: enterobacteria)]